MRVANIKLKEYCDIYIGRGSIWGNPFVIGYDGTREEVINRYEEYLFASPGLLKQLYILKNKDLGCFCASLPCHGDLLLRLANNWQMIGNL